MTNFRLFQNDRVCRRQFKLHENCRKNPKGDKNTVGRAFPTMFSKDLYCRHLKTRA